MDMDVSLTEKFNDNIKFDEINSDSPRIETYKPDKECDNLENKIQEIDVGLKRTEINYGNYLSDLGDSQTAQQITARVESQEPDPISSLSGTESRIQMPSQINEHVTSHGIKVGKNPKLKSWTRIERSSNQGRNIEVTVLPSKRNLGEDDEEDQGDQHKRKKGVLYKEGKNTSSLAEAVSKPRLVK